MAKERADLGFADALDDFDPADWTPGRTRAAPPRPPAAETRKAAAAAGFRSREPRPATDPAMDPAGDLVLNPAAKAAAAPAEARRPAGEAAGEAAGETGVERGAGQGPRPRRRRTGRTAQLNLKVRPETIEAFYALADRQGWGLGEAFEHALRALEAEARRSGPQK